MLTYRTEIVFGTPATAPKVKVLQDGAKVAVTTFGDAEGAAWLENLRPLIPSMARIFVRPERVGILDFETQFPRADGARQERGGMRRPTRPPRRRLIS